MARIINPTSRQGSLRVLAEVGPDSVLYPTLNRHLRGYSAEEVRRELATACARHAKLGPASLVLNDVSTRCVSRPTPATVSASPGSPMNQAAVRSVVARLDDLRLTLLEMRRIPA